MLCHAHKHGGQIQTLKKILHTLNTNAHCNILSTPMSRTLNQDSVYVYDRRYFSDHFCAELSLAASFRELFVWPFFYLSKKNREHHFRPGHPLLYDTSSFNNNVIYYDVIHDFMHWDTFDQTLLCEGCRRDEARFLQDYKDFVDYHIIMV